MDTNSNNEEANENGDQQSESMDDMTIEDPGDRDADFSQLEETVETQRLERLVSEKEQEASDYKDRYMRALADLENYKKRAIKERSELLKYQGESIICDLLPVLDNLELALTHKESDEESLQSGLEMIVKMFQETLERWEIKALDGLGKAFDPNLQNAISKIPVADAEPGSVIQEFKKAYQYKGKLIREAEVVVAEAPVQEADSQAEE